MGKKDKALVRAYIEITPGFDEADAAIDALAQRIQARITKAVADGIDEGMRSHFTIKPLPDINIDAFRATR